MTRLAAFLDRVDGFLETHQVGTGAVRAGEVRRASIQRVLGTSAVQEYVPTLNAIVIPEAKGQELLSVLRLAERFPERHNEAIAAQFPKDPLTTNGLDEQA